MYRIVIATIGLLVVSSAAGGAPAVGLKGDKTLIWFDTDSPAEVKTFEIDGIAMLHGMDLRPADKMVYGVTADGSLVKIDLDTGTATAVAKLSAMLPDKVKASIDFNPAADKLRMLGADGTNLRADPASGSVTTDGVLAFEAGDANAQMKPDIVATAYLNAFGKPDKTAMYNIDASGLFIQQTKPNDGTLKTIGKLGVTMGDHAAFDIQTTADGKNTLWLATGGALYKVNPETGAAEKVAEGIDANLRDLTILP